LNGPLDVPVLVSRLLALLDTSAALAEQLPASASGEPTHAGRTPLELAYHVPQVVVGFLDAALGGQLAREHLERRPPEQLANGADVARLTRSVTQALAVWWGANRLRLPVEVDTYAGRRSLQQLLEYTTTHVARHVRQLQLLLEQSGISPRPSLHPALLAGLPLAGDIWEGMTLP
jgi:uncharacterized damage-inducible protein DinB